MPRSQSPAAATGLPQEMSRPTIPTSFLVPLGNMEIRPAAAVSSLNEIERLEDIETRLQEAVDAIDAQYRLIDKRRRLSFKLAGKRRERYPWFDARDDWYWNYSHARYERRRAAARKLVCFDAAEARLNDLREQRDLIANELWDVKATTIAGLKVKARIAGLTHAAAFSIVHDIREMPEIVG